MRPLVGPHVAGQWANKLDILRQWQPPLVLVLSPELDKVQQLRAACPDAVIVGRFYHDDSHYADNIRTRPKGFALDIHREIIANPATPLLDYVQSNNETNQDWQGIQQLNVYTERWMSLADESQAYKCAILAFSVGNPDLPFKPGDPAGFDGRMLYWQQVLPSLNYAQRNGHILALHAYGYPDMFHPDADWYIYRYERQVQANLRTLGITNLKYAYTEIGIDRLIVDGKGGYKVVTNDQNYVNQLLQWERDQQAQSLLLGGAIFTFGDSGGWDTYDIASTNVASMLAAHYANRDQSPPSTGQDDMSDTAPQLPPRQWDNRLTQRGVTVETPALVPGQKFWRIVRVRWYDEQEADALGPDRHIMIDARDAEGKRVVGLGIHVQWPSDSALIHTEAKPGEEYAVGFGMNASRNEYSVWVAGDNIPSEKLVGVGMGAETPDGFNSGIHTSTGMVVQLVTMPQAQPGHEQHLPTIIAPGPTPAEPQEPSMPSDNWTRSRAFVRRWEGDFQDFDWDIGNWTGCEQGVGEKKGTKYGISACSYPHLDIRNITMQQADDIYFRDYWQRSGADKLPWPYCLVVFDTAVLHGVGTAQGWLAEYGLNQNAFVARRLLSYTRSKVWQQAGAGWVNRVGELMLEASKV